MRYDVQDESPCSQPAAPALPVTRRRSHRQSGKRGSVWQSHTCCCRCCKQKQPSSGDEANGDSRVKMPAGDARRRVYEHCEAQAIAQRRHWQTCSGTQRRGSASWQLRESLTRPWREGRTRHPPFAIEFAEHAAPKNWKSRVPRNSAATQAGGTLPASIR